MLRTARQRSARAARRRSAPAAVPEVLESRALLSASGGTRVITAAENGMAVTVDSTEFSAVELTAGADIGTLTIQGSECDIDVMLMGSASSLNVQGGSGSERVFLEAGGSLGSVNFQGGDGIDLLAVDGVVEGSLTFNGDGDTDLLRIRGEGEVRGGISGSGGEGRDGFDVFDQAIVDNVSFDLGAGDDRGEFNSTSPTTGNFTLTTGDGPDVLQFQEGFTIGGNQTVGFGDGEDLLITRGMTVEGNQTFNLGGGSDVVRLGADTIQGGSTINYMDGIDLREFDGPRTIQSDYSVVTQGGTGRAVVFLNAGSTVGGNLTVDTFGETVAEIGLTVEMGNATINTGTGSGSGADTVTILDGTEIGGNVTATLGGSEADRDRLFLNGEVRIGDRAAGTNGNFSAAFGGGEDLFVSEQLVLNGNQSLDFGATPDGGQETVRFGDDLIDGSSTVEAGGGIDLVESAIRRILGDYSITAGAGESRVATQRTRVTNSGNFIVTAAGPLRLNSSVVVTSGNATINAGAGDDVIDLRRSNTSGNLAINAGADDDLIRFGTAVVGGNLNVSGSGGNDDVRNAGVRVTGTPTYNGGSGRADRIQARPADAQISGFES